MEPMQDSVVKEENTLNEVEKGADSRVYELGYLLVPSIAEENLPVVYGNLKELVNSFKGEIISDEMPKMIPLAYTMAKVITNVRHKFNTAYFGWIKFFMDSEKVLELKKNTQLLQISLMRKEIIKSPSSLKDLINLFCLMLLKKILSKLIEKLIYCFQL